MHRLTMWTTALLLPALALSMPLSAALSQSTAGQQIDLTERLTAGKLRAVNREVSSLPGSRPGVHVT